MAIVKIACVVLMCMVVVAPYAEALTCGQVTSALAPCIHYLTSAGGSPPPPCCTGVKKLLAQSRTPADRKTACNCMKTASGSVHGLNLGNAAQLPAKCGVNIPYKISPSTDCSRVG